MPTEDEIAAAAKLADETKSADAVAAKAANDAEEAELKKLGEKGIEALREERQRAKDAEVARIAAEKRANDAEGKLAADAAAKAKAATKKAEDDGNWQKLADDRAAEVETLRTQLKERDRQALITRMAAKHKLPEAFAERLKGETEDELEADAKELAKHVGVRQAPDTEGGAGARSGSRTTQQTAVKTTEPGTLPDGTKKKAWPG